MMKALVSLPDGAIKDSFLNEGSKRILEENFEVIYNELGRNYTTEELTELIKSVDILITCWGTPSCIGGPLHGNTNLKMIAHLAGSVGDLVDDEAYDLGIKVASGNRLFAESVAEGTVGYMLAALRRIPSCVIALRDGLWRGAVFGADNDPETYSSRGLLDREIGLIGFGMITKELIKMLRVFRCRIKIYSQYPIDPEYLKENNATQTSSLDEIFSTCSVVSLHSSLNDKTRGMITGDHIRSMPKHGIFINSARGAIVREDELAEALAERPDVYAVLDVFIKEPLAADSPLRKLENAYLQPHMGGPTIDRREHIGRAVVEECVRFSRGEELQFEITRAYSSRMTKQTH